MPIAAATFVGVLLIFMGLYWLFVLRSEGAAGRALGKGSASPSPKTSPVTLTNPVPRRSSLPLLEDLLHRSALVVGPLERLLEQSGLRITLGRLVLSSVFAAMLAFLLVARLGGGPIQVAALAAAVLSGYAPYLLVRWMARRRIGKFEEQFPEAIALIARALRAGHALPTGLGMVTQELPEPVRGEFKLLYDRQNYGMPLPDALRAFADRVPLLDARFFATAVLTQREAGGNLAEVLDSLAAIIRDRFRLRRQVRVVSAHGRITGIVLAVLPLAIGAILYLVQPTHIERLFQDEIGRQIVVYAGLAQLVGYLIIRRIVNIDV